MSLGDMEVYLEDVEDSIEMIYGTNKLIIEDIINDIRNGSMELCAEYVAHLI